MAQVLTQKYVVGADDFAAAGAASAAVKKTLKQLSFPVDFIRRTSIAMYEGEINMVIHGGGGIASVEIYEDCVKITLADTGPGIPDIEQAMQEGFSTATDSIRELGFGAGMGLPNIKKQSDEFEIISEIGKGTKLTITLNANS
ncbi:MAG: ATP-binding protein [Oscillospiraceae bacterium]|jgi:anti-sigma regulatory factor (Ser/Thr protein kinase)|nr:ATP-binding protein [Oscillospiraceae bacterium]